MNHKISHVRGEISQICTQLGFERRCVINVLSLVLWTISGILFCENLINDFVIQ